MMPQDEKLTILIEKAKRKGSIYSIANPPIIIPKQPKNQSETPKK